LTSRNKPIDKRDIKNPTGKGDKKMAQNDDLGSLISLLNPYTNNKQTSKGGQSTGDWDVYMSNPTPTPGGASGATIAQIQLQVDANYPGEWTFKGEPQKINKAVRILYRYPVMDPASTAAHPIVSYWIEDYLLIGFEGSGAG
jgi:hypothetical protein